MRHQKHRTSLGLNSGHRKALLNNLVRGLVEHNRITTTLKKAKAASRFADKLITIAKRNDLHARRQLFAYLKSRTMVQYVMNELAPCFKDRNGGYTRIIRYKTRNGDGALLAILEFVEIPVKEEKKHAKKKQKKEKKPSKDVVRDVKEEKVAQDGPPAGKTKEPAKDKQEAAEESSQEGETADKDEKKSGFFTNLRGFLKK